MKFLFRWLFRLAVALLILGIVVLVALVLSVDKIAKEVLVNRLRSATGMEASVGSVQIGLLSPTISIEDVKLYNKADFGGSVCLEMPELHLEYEPSDLAKGRLHLTLLRLNVANLSIVEDKSGRVNFGALQKKGQKTSARSGVFGLNFTGIDVLNVTLGKFHDTNLKSGREEEIEYGIKNKVLRNVKSEADLNALGLGPLPTGKGSSGNSGPDLGRLLDGLLGP